MMRLLAIWISTGGIVGAAAGAPFGGIYMLAGAGLGITAGVGIAIGLRAGGG